MGQSMAVATATGTQVAKIDAATLRNLRDAINNELAELGDAYGVSFKAGAATYDRGGKFASFTLTVGLVQDGGKVMTKEEIDWPRFAPLFGLAVGDLHREFNHAGARYEVTGLLSRGRTTPILCRQIANGKTYKFGGAAVKRYLDASASPAS